MKPGAGKAKGGEFERLCCRRLSLWLSRGSRDDLLWRSAMSGGRATLSFAKGKIANKTQTGDVSAVGAEAFAFCEATYIECKTYAALQIDRGLLCGTGGLHAFWRETDKQAARHDKRPLLIARQNRTPTIALARADAAPVFDRAPLLVLNHWKVHLYLFEDATQVDVPMIRRR